jgi:type IV pilus assembly protein PilA
MVYFNYHNRRSDDMRVKVNRNFERGFTLVELLAVIVILAIVLAIAIPGIGAIINSSKVAAYNSQMDLMKRAASLYVSQYGDSNTNSVRLDQLVSTGLIQNTPTNPMTNQPFDNIIIDVSGANSTNGYSVYEGPELATGMIPVYYDDATGLWKKADKTNPNGSWYGYNNQKWANAVTVTSTNRSTYQSAAAGTTIAMSDINTMFVWIPRFKYMIPLGTGAREIKIQFETKYAPKSTGDAINSYYTHTAFTFNGTELGGIWVGKFETTGTITAPTILPDTTSIRSQTEKLCMIVSRLICKVHQHMALVQIMMSI